MALFGSDQVIDEFPGRRIYVGKKDGNKLEKHYRVRDEREVAARGRSTYARTGMLEADLANKQILMHLYGARYQERDSKDPFNLRKIRDAINTAEGTLPISLEELDQKQKKRPSRSALSIEQLLEHSRARTHGNAAPAARKSTNDFRFRSRAWLLRSLRVPLGVTAHRRETSIGFAMGLIVATTYFLFVIVGDTLRGNPHAHPELLVWFPNVLFIVLGGALYSAVSRGSSLTKCAVKPRPYGPSSTVKRQRTKRDRPQAGGYKIVNAVEFSRKIADA